MSTRMHSWLAAGALLAAVLAGCGGGGGGGGGGGSQVTTVETSLGGVAPLVTSDAPAAHTGTGVVMAAAANVLPVTVDRGVRGTSFNAPFVTVTVCMPGTGTCTQIDHVMVDTGSWGLRLAASALPSQLALPQVPADTGGAAAECVKFVGGYAWGSVRRADLQLAGQKIQNLPVHVMADPDPAFAATPSSCSSAGNNLGTRLDAKGILGVGMLKYDCGSNCATSTAPQIYYGCSGAGCVPSTLPVASQVVNPVAALPVHNNGVALALQQVQTGGVGTVSGALVLGIGTESNNQLGSASVLAPDASGLLTVSFKGRSLPAYIDSGTNALLFPDTDLPRCGDFFCPGQPGALDVTMRSMSGVQRTATVVLESPPPSLSTTAAAAVVAAPYDNQSLWGLPFFYGRTVFIAQKNADTPAGKGPYWAF